MAYGDDDKRAHKRDYDARSLKWTGTQIPENDIHQHHESRRHSHDDRHIYWIRKAQCQIEKEYKHEEADATSKDYVDIMTSLYLIITYK